MCAFVWIMPVSFSELPFGSFAVIERSRPVTDPVATAGVPPLPRALPIPDTWSPTETDEESPGVIVSRFEASWSWISATSCAGSTPTTVAVYEDPSGTFTEIFQAPCTTWLLVRTSPSDVRTMPVPAPSGISWLGGASIWRPKVVTSTIPASVAPLVAPLVLVLPFEPFDNEIAVTEPTTSVPTSATATIRGTHFEGFFGAGWSGRGAQPTGEGVAGWVHPVSGGRAATREARACRGWHRASGLCWGSRSDT